MVTPGTEIPLATPLPRSPDQSVGLVLPAVLSDRLDRLVMIAEQHGERTSRREIVAALLLAARPSGHTLSELIHSYRRADVSAALIGPRADDKAFVVPKSKPGPRPRHDRVI